jgi:hypothetical protein
MNIQEAIKRIAQEILEANKTKLKGEKKAKDFGNGKLAKGKQSFKNGSAKPVKENQLIEQSSDPIVDDTAGAIVHSLITAIEDNNDAIANDAFEVMMGSSPDEDRLTLARFEDVDATAELIVQAIYRDPGLHDTLHNMVSMLLRNAMRTMGH